MIVIKLKEAMLDFGRKNDVTVTYEMLSGMTNIPTQTLRSIGSRPGYHTSVARIEVLCRTLRYPLHQMLEMIDDPPKRKRKATKKRK